MTEMNDKYTGNTLPFIGLEIGELRFPEHHDSVTARREPGKSGIVREYALWGSGPNRWGSPKITKTRAELEVIYGPGELRG